MAPTLMKDFRASFRRKKTSEPTLKIDKLKEKEDEELAKLLELKENLKGNIPAQYNDLHLLSFLRARSLNVNEAEKLMRLDVNLKLFLRLGDMLNEYDVLPGADSKYSCSGLIGFDKEGHPVRVINIGYSDIKGFCHCTSTIETFRIFMWYLEKDHKKQEIENRKYGRKAHGMVYILNFDHINLGKVMYKPALDTALLACKLLQDHYHDSVKTVFLINAPSFFSSVFKLFKPVIQDNLHKRIRVFERDGWKEELLKHIDADVLPAYLGGSRYDNNDDPMCKSVVGFGGSIPDLYYPREFLDPNDPEVMHITIPSASFVVKRFQVDVVGTHIKYYVQAKENDIGIGVYLESPDQESSSVQGKAKKKKEEDLSKMEQVTPIIRTQCHICPEIGYLIAWFTGTIVVTLDNTYSWMHSKEAMLKVEMTPPPQNNVSTNSNQKTTE